MMKAIQVYCKSYIWLGVNVITKKPLVSWDKMCLPKVAGGMNKINLEQSSYYEIVLEHCTKARQPLDQMDTYLLYQGALT